MLKLPHQKFPSIDLTELTEMIILCKIKEIKDQNESFEKYMIKMNSNQMINDQRHILAEIYFSPHGPHPSVFVFEYLKNIYTVLFCFLFLNYNYISFIN